MRLNVKLTFEPNKLTYTNQLTIPVRTILTCALLYSVLVIRVQFCQVSTEETNRF